jgi:hypothetical protein
MAGAELTGSFNTRNVKQRVITAVVAVAERNGQKAQDYARQNAPWIDRTSNARQGLFSQVEQQGDTVYIHLAHSVDYGKWLELANAGKYAIIMQSLREIIPDLREDLEVIFK